ncbi:1-acyl-sn-glycerol-3-phosphate acyltransferase [bacterium CPR1]|nr:1-acyl-sn-glycerol-3-phosphate acyltransferase [bacterium CPR1]
MLVDLLIGFLRVLIGGYLRPHTMFGDEMPRQGPALVAANHPTVLDGVVLGLWAPRRLRFLVAGHLFDNPFMGWFLRVTGCIPVGRPGSFEAALQALERGEWLGIFPEGTISGSEKLLEFRTGVARLALLTGTPVYPTAIAGTLRLFSPERHRLQPGPVVLAATRALRFERQSEPVEEVVRECLTRIRLELEAQAEVARQALELARGPAGLRTVLTGLVLVPLAWVLSRSEPVPQA